ncbi:hypothetical protein [Lentzea sp. NEAU-D7]|uniref:hypothetical protein n=1 Tax=Lentzea sp. NEAU-D7 TaxID=2994667 RepID=UPI00224B3316|nr:hypothetical protein [Lentzea sp. NEAU-D7]MCX2946760.1 hypothetical protein [Lentzea sp. NEAU-D7]
MRWVIAVVVAALVPVAGGCERHQAVRVDGDQAVRAVDGDWQIRFDRVYPPANQPPRTPPRTPADSEIVMSVSLRDGRITRFLSVTEDGTGRIWVDSSGEPGRGLALRYWLSCDGETSELPELSFVDLLRDVAGPLEVPSNATGTAGGRREWSAPAGVAEMRIVQEGTAWDRRRVSYHRPGSGKHLYTVSGFEVSALAAGTVSGRVADAGHRYREECGAG